MTPSTDRPATEQHRRMILPPSSRDFLNPAHEWRRVFAETWGTFLLVMVAAGGGIVAASSGGAVTPGMIVVAPGLMVMAIIYFMGSVSGAHLNPAVTLAFAVRCNFPWRRVPGYVLAQVVGGVAATLFLRAMFGTCDDAGAGCRQREGAHYGSSANSGVCEYDSGHGLRSAKHRRQRCYRSRWIHRFGGPLGGAG